MEAEAHHNYLKTLNRNAVFLAWHCLMKLVAVDVDSEYSKDMASSCYALIVDMSMISASEMVEVGFVYLQYFDCG